MEGYPLNDTYYSNVTGGSSLMELTSTCSTNIDNPDFIMESMEPMKEVEWQPIITIKENLINQLKNPINCDIDEKDIPEFTKLDLLADNLIDFMKQFKKVQEDFREAESFMKESILENQKHIDVLSTFIEFLNKISSQVTINTQDIQNQIKLVSEQIKDTNDLKQIKETYLLKKKIYNKYLNMIRLINQTNVGSTCSVCLSNNVNSYFNPCGHTCCERCCSEIKSIGDFKCPLCRVRFSKISKLYFT